VTLVERTRWGLDWKSRPAEEAAHFNPAFCTELIARAVSGYEWARSAPLPLAVTYLVLPLTLSPDIRAALPKRADTAFASWAGTHAELLSDIPERMLRLRPVTREALLFAAQVGALSLKPEGVHTGDRPLRFSARLAAVTDETASIRSSAGLLGRWFGAQASAVAVLQTFGVQV
jgi:hypothetical protein